MQSNHTEKSQRKLAEELISCLSGDSWLNDEVIHAFICIVADGTRFTPLDPCLIQTQDVYRIRGYPIRDGELLFPLNMYGNHWALAWLRPARKSIVLYDSMGHLYSYSSRLLPLQEREKLERSWHKVTDRGLDVILVESAGGVHVQEDSYNCGVFVCLYAERLCREERTVQEVATAKFLQDYRQYIRNRITSSDMLYRTGELDCNGNLYCCIPRKEADQAKVHECAMSVPERPWTSSPGYLVDVTKESEQEYKDKDVGIRVSGLEPPTKLARVEDVENDHCYTKPFKHISTNGTWLSPRFLADFLRFKYAGSNETDFVVLGRDACCKRSSHLSSVFILYPNRTKQLGVAMITRTLPSRSRGVVLDFTATTMRNNFRQELKNLATTCGFANPSFAIVPITKNFSWTQLEVQAVGICTFVENCMQERLSMEVQLPTEDKIRRTLDEMRLVMKISDSSEPSAYRKRKARNVLANSSNVEFFTLGEMNKMCPACGAFLFQRESSSVCCNGGEVIVPESVFNPRRDPLLDWFWEAALRDENLFYMIRPINNMLACAGLCLNLRSFKGSSGQRPLVLQGRFDIGLCHLNPDSDRACFAQLFIADDFKVQRSIEETMKLWDTKVDFTLLRKIMDILRKYNPIVQSYMTMYEIYIEELKKQSTQGADAPKVIMNIKQRRDVAPSLTSNIHPGRLNVPVFENQIAAIYVSKDGGMLTHEELNEGLWIMSRGGKTIAPHFSYNIDPLTYPLYFVRGEQTFVKEKLPKHRVEHCVINDPGLLLEKHYEEDTDDNMDDNRVESKDERKTRFISRREFALYILARRGDIHTHRIIGTGKLYSQYVLHTFARIEADRLSSIGLHHTELRSSTASSLFRYLDDKLNEKGVKLGKLVNMPQKFVGSRNWYQKLYSDAMAVAQRLGKPDLFITFTGNQDWPEIKNNLPGKFDSWITDPFLCCRVFFLRLTELLHDIKKKEIFGKVLALHGSIEFQKRGMPHAHLLITLENKIDTPEKIDSIICAEIPEYPSADDPQREEKLRFHTLMKKHMIHGPCSERPGLACREADSSKCARGYPKRYREHTELCSGGYPLYRRRNDGRVVPVGKLGKTFASNRDVVPTNPYLLMKHECHVNVEVCAAIQAFKYIFKYIFKGPDAVVLELVQDDVLLKKSTYMNEKNEKLVNIDMREVYRLARYVSHIEAAYRILRYPMQYSSHTVISLMPHLPNEEPIYFNKTPNVAKSNKSKLLAYFELAATDEKVKNMTWVDVAESYRFSNGKYVRYKREGRRIARLWSVNPKMLELYAVRKLLLYRKGVQSFEDLRSHNGKLYSTFMEAAQAAGYIEKSSEWEDCLRCACTEEMPSTVRKLYAHILLYCKPSNPLELWHKFKADMRSKQCTEAVAMEDLKSLRHIEHILTANGMKMSDCGLDGIISDLGDDVGVQSEIFEDSDNDKARYDQESEIGMLNKKQQHVILKVLEAAKLKKSSDKNMFFIYGKAGCGKTYTFNTLIRLLKHIGLSVIAVASTGIAATLLESGRTAHSTFSLPLKRLSADAVANVDASSVQGMMLRGVDVIIWDEISMQSRFAIETVDRLLRDIAAPENRMRPFGGVVMVFGGDWCQFLPVLPGASKVDTINETLKASYLWKMMQILVLDENMRLRPGEEDYAAWLRGVGEGTNFNANGTDVEIPVEMCMESEDEVIEWMYTEQVLRDPNLIGSMALLTVRNSDAMELNERVLKMIPGDAVALYGIDTPVSEQEGIFGMPCDDEEFLHNLTPSGMPPFKLLLKPGAIIMLLRNINIEERLCNGTRLQVLSITCDNRMLKCKNLLTQETTHITRMPLDFSDERTGVAFRRYQFPVRLSYCMTINKSQGQTFEKVGIIMRTPSFAHGSTYVALSRARSKGQVKITMNSRRPKRQSLQIRNIVYSEIIEL